MSEELEFQISQYVDGVLPVAQRAELDRLLETDASARQMLADHRRVVALLKADALPDALPDVRWEAFAQSISHAVDEAADARADRMASAYRMPAWVRSAVLPFALAASLAIATGIAWRILKPSAGQGVSHEVAIHPPVQTPPTAVHNDAGGAADSVSVRTAQPSETTVHVGPPDAGANEDGGLTVAVGPSTAGKEPAIIRYSDELVSRPSSVMIASGLSPAHDDVASGYLSDMQ